jgi:hypothetical protein
MNQPNSRPPAAGTEGKDGELPHDAGHGPPWEVADLPEPLPFSFRNTFRVIGPGAILLATAIGGGEWVVGPTQAVKHGMGLFWIVTVAIFLQVIFNLEAMRYTLYTGEPIYGGILRLWPGRRFWGAYYALKCFLQLGSPALAGLAAASIFSMAAERLPETGDVLVKNLIAIGLLLAVVAILLFGGTIERMLEIFAWIMLALMFSFLLVVNVFFIEPGHWLATFKGFIGLVPPSGGTIDWALLGALAATAGSGGMGNLTVTNWARDKGFGMGALTGAIPSAVGGRHVSLSPMGKAFPAREPNLSRWRTWMRYVAIDQVWIWGLFCFFGMYLNVNLATRFIEPGTNMEGQAAGAIQAAALREIWHPFWIITLLSGFWVLFKTHLGNTDILVRTITDVLWLSSRRVRAWRGGDVRRVYYSILAFFTVWAAAVLWTATAAALFKVLANIAGLVLAVASIQVFWVNRRFLPRALRPPLWRQISLLACSAFYWFFSIYSFPAMWRELSAQFSGK